MKTPKIFNPLYADQASTFEAQAATGEGDGDKMVATAAIYHDKIGICPKCDTQMGTGVIANHDAMYYCEKCRVTTPFQDN